MSDRLKETLKVYGSFLLQAFFLLIVALILWVWCLIWDAGVRSQELPVRIQRVTSD
jgi:hypothetical protein